MKKSIKFLPLLSMVLVVVGCQDYDAGFTESDIKAKQYANDFQKTFGNVDPNQDWSMASSVTANVNMNGDVHVAIYSENPVSANAKVLASFSGNSATFNGIKGDSQVYAMVFEGSEVVAKGYYDIKDGAVEIGNKAMTRAEGSAVTVTGTAATLTFDSPDMVWNTAWSAAWPTFEGYMASNAQSETKCEDDLPVWTLKNGKYVVEYDGQKYWIDNWHFVKGQKSIELKDLSGIPTSDVTGFTLGQFYDMFGPGTFFQEGISYHDSPKYPEMYADGDLEKLERGVEIITDGGEINVPFIYGATQNYTKFGYVYFKDGEDDPFSKPHYILIDQTHPDVNITFSDGTAVGDMQLSNWNTASDLCSDPRNEKPLTSSALTGSEQMIGTNYKLYFFGDEENAEGFSFPAGYRIVFFIVQYSAKQDKFDADKFNYSLRDYNRRISHGYNYKDSEGNFPGCDGNHKGWGQDPCTGIVKAGAWQYGDRLMLGFEDGTDDDLNDILFWIDGSFHTDEEIIVPDIPVPDPEPETETVETETSWIYASEDLGGTFDYDFNDVVWAVVNKYEVTRNKATKAPVSEPVFKGSCIRLLACGGTLPVQLLFDGNVVGGKELHQQFGQPEADLYKANVSPASIDIALSNTEAITIDDTFNKKFSVKVEDGDASNHFITTPDKEAGEAPQIIVLTGDWEWPNEGMPIVEAYPEFTNWTKDVAWTTWASKKKPGSTVARSH